MGESYNFGKPSKRVPHSRDTRKRRRVFGLGRARESSLVVGAGGSRGRVRRRANSNHFFEARAKGGPAKLLERDDEDQWPIQKAVRAKNASARAAPS
ncbi:hypothetical protein MTO96_013310 [Rhipicephalus appendiculatus]